MNIVLAIEKLSSHSIFIPVSGLEGHNLIKPMSQI
jgi:translation elongation factor EF-1alpha